MLIKRNNKVKITNKNNYEVKVLIENIPYQENTKIYEYLIKNKDYDELDLKETSECWGYNIGNNPINLKWSNKIRKINPGDSFFIKPNTKHAFKNLDNKEGKVLIIQINPGEGNAFKELYLINKYVGEQGIKRIHTETTRWF